MDLPITKPIKISYGDELNFDKLLDNLTQKRHNGFIRITHGSSEGYILFKDGTAIAASYDRYMKSEALKKILEIVDKYDTLLELFEVKDFQIDYLVDVNRVYKLETTFKDIKSWKAEAGAVEEPEAEAVEEPEAEAVEEPEAEAVEEPEAEAVEEPEAEAVEEPEAEAVEEPEAEAVEEPEIPREKEKEPIEPKKISPKKKLERPLNRKELMKKYGLKELDNEEVEKLLESYKGGAFTGVDIERVELTLMNKIKQSIMEVSDIKNVEAMIFIDNTSELGGNIKIFIERESKGIFSRLLGDVISDEELEEHIRDIVEMEIKKTFRDYPEIVDNFDISIKIR